MRKLLFLFISIHLLAVGFLQPEEAFKPKASSLDNHMIGIEIELGDQIYLYADKLKVEDSDPQDGIDFASVTMNDPVDHEGEKVYETSPSIRIKLGKNTEVSGKKSVRIKLSYQGCSSAGLCYEPMTKELVVELAADMLPNKDKALDSHINAPSIAAIKKDENKSVEIPNETTVEKSSETDQIANVIKGGSLWVIIVSFFGFGLLLSLTPCVFPMIPIISSVILAQGEGLGAKRAFWLSLVYVLSMAVAYTIAGILAGLFGANLQAAFQTPWVITAFALIFVLLSLSMFDVYELQIPNFIQSRLSKIGSQRGGVIGIAIMGFLSALIVGPCVAAPLAGALIYIGQTGDALLGGVALFSLSIGMGVLLLIVGTTSGKFMPRPGMWMDAVKAVFGVLLLGIAIWMMGRVLDENTTLLLWGGLAVFVAVNMNALEPLGVHPSWSSRANVKALGIMILLYGFALLIGGMAGAKNVLHPLDPFVASSSEKEVRVTEHKTFEKIVSIEELDAILAENKGKRVLVDFYADWCSACKELEEKTFSNEEVKTAMDEFVLVQVDLTANDKAAKAISTQYGIFGPPVILFFDTNGTRIKSADMVGFKEPQEFLNHLGAIQ